MHAACLEAEIPGSVSKSEPVQGATIACVTPGTRSDSVRFAHSHEQSYDAVYIRSGNPELPRCQPPAEDGQSPPQKTPVSGLVEASNGRAKRIPRSRGRRRERRLKAGIFLKP